MRYLFAILISVALCAVPISAGAITASITLDVHQDIQAPTDKLPNDFHVVGHVKSYISAPVLSWHTDGPFTNFSYTITKVDPSNPADPWYNFTADWSLPAGSPGIPYCTIIHLGLLFDVEGANTVIDLEGYWTRDGVQMGQIISGQHNNGFVPIAGFDVVDTPTAEGLKLRITNGKQSDPPLPPPGPTPQPFETEIVRMDVIGFLPGQAPSPEALQVEGAQSGWNWVQVNNANGQPISPTNPMYAMPDSFFDVFLETVVPGHPSLPLGQQIHLQPGGTLVARTLTQFTNNAGLPEQRWQWDVHQAPNTVDWGPGDEYKWVQMPDVSNTGIDIRCDVNDGIPRVLADDFKCIEVGPITDVHFWGSWLNDNKGNIQKIHLSLHQDVPAGATGTFSHPADPAVWQADFFPGSFSEKLYRTLPTPQHEWWWDPYTNTLQQNGDTQVWQYDIPIQTPFVQMGTPQNPIIYWLDVSVTLDPVQPPKIQPQFGWKTRDWRTANFGGGHFMDDAVKGFLGTAPNWQDLHYPESHPKAPNSLDMSFVITGPMRQRDWGDAPDSLTAVGYPTLSTHSGASHGIIPGFCLGNTVDAEGDGQPTAIADGDDINPPLGIDDEDGVAFAGPLIAGQSNTMTVIASAPGLLDVWVDFGANGSWDPGEQILVSQLLVAGANVLTFPVPAGATLGQTFARFRFSSTGGLQPAGWANDGEVEDYVVTIQQQEISTDWGDAPDAIGAIGYQTLAANNGARHKIVTGFRLGATVDAEVDGQPTANADGDDINPPAGIDDEDGVTIPTPMLIGNTYTINVLASAAGKLDAWIDWAANGTWDAGDQICAGVPLVAGNNPITITVPAGASPGMSYARFRFSSVGGLPPFGPATDGEVEDYTVYIERPPQEKWDWGDAPDSLTALGFPTLAINNGARHLIVQGIQLGAAIDTEPDGQPTANADGDDLNPLMSPDDEDGVSWTPFVQGQATTITVMNSVPGQIDAWIDWNGDNDWADLGEQIASINFAAAGPNTFTFNVPVGAVNMTYMRVRFNTGGPLGFSGAASNGEVEDYRIFIEPPMDELDWGDAPDDIQLPGYPTLAIHNGARHIINPAMHLGNFIDAEVDGRPNWNADGDDIFPAVGPDDEDGVFFKPTINAGCWNQVKVFASVPGILNAWMDFNYNFSWADPGDQIFVNRPLSPGWNLLGFFVPANSATVPTYSRWRYNSTGGLTYTGLAQDGEVEDYKNSIRVRPSKPIVGANNRSVWLDPSLYRYLFLNNGMVKTWGKVMSIGSDTFDISDGHTTPVTIIGPTTGLTTTKTVSVTGVLNADRSINAMTIQIY